MSVDPSRSIGFTPTMGALHAGHLSHLHALAPVVDLRICSVYVNPTQFAPDEDLERYPRDLERDAELLAEAGCDLLFFPSDQSMYPAGYSTYVEVEGISSVYEGAHRPSHFRGVSTIVAKFLGLVRPDVMTLGRKDAQQLALLERMVIDLNIDTRILPIPTVRAEDGLAMSSRNAFLSADERERARSISRALGAGSAAFAAGADPEGVEVLMRRELDAAIQPDYLDVVDRRTFGPPNDETTEHLAIFAGYVGSTRLIDNLILESR